MNSVSYWDRDVQIGAHAFEFIDFFGDWGVENRLTAGERVDWSLSFAGPTTFVLPEFALWVSDIGAGGSGVYIPTSPIPEPQTYAMLLAGLGLLGLGGRRRAFRRAAA